MGNFNYMVLTLFLVNVYHNSGKVYLTRIGVIFFILPDKALNLYPMLRRFSDTRRFTFIMLLRFTIYVLSTLYPSAALSSFVRPRITLSSVRSSVRHTPIRVRVLR